MGAEEALLERDRQHRAAHLAERRKAPAGRNHRRVGEANPAQPVGKHDRDHPERRQNIDDGPALLEGDGQGHQGERNERERSDVRAVAILAEGMTFVGADTRLLAAATGEGFTTNNIFCSF